MNKKITIYELLGLVKENKQPVVIKYIKNGKYYKWNNTQHDYMNANDYFIYKEPISEILTNNVEIIQENQQIEKLNIECENEKSGNCYIKNEQGTKCFLTKHSKIIVNKLNEVINMVNEFKNNLDKMNRRD